MNKYIVVGLKTQVKEKIASELIMGCIFEKRAFGDYRVIRPFPSRLVKRIEQIEWNLAGRWDASYVELIPCPEKAEQIE